MAALGSSSLDARDAALRQTRDPISVVIRFTPHKMREKNDALVCLVFSLSS